MSSDDSGFTWHFMKWLLSSRQNESASFWMPVLVGGADNFVCSKGQVNVTATHFTGQSDPSCLFRFSVSHPGSGAPPPPCNNGYGVFIMMMIMTFTVSLSKRTMNIHSITILGISNSVSPYNWMRCWCQPLEKNCIRSLILRLIVSRQSNTSFTRALQFLAVQSGGEKMIWLYSTVECCIVKSGPKLEIVRVDCPTQEGTTVMVLSLWFVMFSLSLSYILFAFYIFFSL